MTDTDKILQALARLEAGQKALQTDVKGLHSDVQHLQTDVKGLQEGQKALQTDVNALQTDVKSLKEGEETLDLKVETFHAEQNEANKEIITTIHDVVTIDAKVIADWFERIEKHLNLPPLK